MTLPRSVELEWQRDVIEKRLNAPCIPFETRINLLEMLNEVKEEMGRLEVLRSHLDEHTNRQASQRPDRRKRCRLRQQASSVGRGR